MSKDRSSRSHRESKSDSTRDRSRSRDHHKESSRIKSSKDRHSDRNRHDRSERRDDRDGSRDRDHRKSSSHHSHSSRHGSGRTHDNRRSPDRKKSRHEESKIEEESWSARRNRDLERASDNSSKRTGAPSHWDKEKNKPGTWVIDVKGDQDVFRYGGFDPLAAPKFSRAGGEEPFCHLASRQCIRITMGHFLTESFYE